MSTSPAVAFGPEVPIASLLEEARFAERPKQAQLLLQAALMHLSGLGCLVVSSDCHQVTFKSGKEPGKGVRCPKRTLRAALGCAEYDESEISRIQSLVFGNNGHKDRGGGQRRSPKHRSRQLH